MNLGLSRRAVVGAALALAACERGPNAQAATPDLPPLKSVAPFPVGTCAQAFQLEEPDLSALIAAQVSQLTPEWEMKMEYIAQDDGSLNFDAPDRIAAFARAHGVRLFGHTLVWYAQEPPAFKNLKGGSDAFAAAYRKYITAVVGRYRGQAVAWDVVNEAVAEDGDGWRECLWSRQLGPLDYMVRAFHHAREADPDAVLFLNDYNLENRPAKRATFMKLVEALLKAGAPLGGIGTQTHIAADLPPGRISEAIKDLASFGLPIHVSEMDVSLSNANGLHGRAELEAGQARLYEEAARAFSGLPPQQRFAFTHWGLRDPDSWLNYKKGGDHPLLFDGRGRAKPATAAWIDGLR